MYKVIRYFTDLQDNNFPYNVGDKYPRDGKEVSSDRIKELSTAANKQGAALIEEVRETAKTVSAENLVDTEEAVSVESEPKKRGRKRKE